MTEPRFLPGPWAIIHQKSEFNSSYWIGPVESGDLWNMSIAEVRNGAEDEEYGGPEVELANAHLVAAAPALYAALVAAKEELRFIRMNNTRAVYNPALRTQIAVALAQARGEVS
jgi:hypothetical protein